MIDNNKNSFRDSVLTLAGVALLLALLRESSAIVVPFLLSLFIAIIAATPLQKLKQRGLSTLLSVVIVIAVVLIVMVLIAMMLGNSATQFNAALPVYEARLDELANQGLGYLTAKGIEFDKVGIMRALDASAILSFTNTLISGIGDALSNIFLIVFIVIFMLIEASGFSRKLAILDGEDGNTILAGAAELVQSVNRYVAAKAVVSLATGTLIWISLEFVGLDFAPLWGFLAFVLNFIPNIGSVLAAVPAVLLAMLQLDLTAVLVVIAIYVVINTVIGNLIEPAIMGQRVGLSVLAVFLSLIFWGWMFGPIGMLLSVPLSMVVKFAAHSNPQTRWFAILLEPAPPVADENDASTTGLKKGT